MLATFNENDYEGKRDNMYFTEQVHSVTITLLVAIFGILVGLLVSVGGSDGGNGRIHVRVGFVTVSVGRVKLFPLT